MQNEGAIMDKINVVSGTTTVYDTHQMKEPLAQADDYPIAWEIVFRNDRQGKDFAAALTESFRELPKEKGFVLDTEIPINEPVRCIECVFKDKDSFRRVLNQVFKDRSFVDELTGKVIPKIQLLNDATKLVQRHAALVC
ncbi:MAG: hypothetical protein AAF731_06060 [Bacteroidota bacterium]